VFQMRYEPVVSIDAKKKQSAGEFNNGGRQRKSHGQRLPVRANDVLEKKLGAAIPGLPA